MQKYQFTGHLTPLPPGIKLPLQISGEVYLASDVEQMRANFDAAAKLHAQVVADKDKLIATLERSNNRLRQKIDRLSS